VPGEEVSSSVDGEGGVDVVCYEVVVAVLGSGCDSGWRLCRLLGETLDGVDVVFLFF
jgi:hypothetical protein